MELNLSEVSSSPQVQELDELINRQKVLEQSIAVDDFAHESIKAAYVETHASITEQIDNLLGDNGVMEGLHCIYETSVKGVRQLDDLREITGEDLDVSLREQLSVRVEGIAKLLGRITLSRSGMQTEPIAATTTKQQERAHTDELSDQLEKEKTSITLTISSKAVSIGEKGKTILFDRRAHSGQKSYKEARRLALIFMIENQDKEISPNELWEGIRDELGYSGVSQQEGQDVVNNIRSWFSHLTYRRSAIITHNGVRGLGSRYKASDAFSINLAIQESKTEDTIELVGITKDVMTEKSESIISTRDLAVVAAKLNQIRDALEYYDFTTINPEVLEELCRSCNQEQSSPQLRNELEYERQQAFGRLQELIDDDKKIFDYIDACPEDSVQIKFMEYFLDLDESNDRELMQRLIAAEFRGVDRTDLRRNVYNVGHTQELIDVKTGEILWSSDPTLIRKDVSEADLSKSALGVSGVSHADTDAHSGLELPQQDEAISTQLDPSEEELLSDEVNDELTNRRNASRTEVRKQFHAEVKTRIEEFAISLKEHMPNIDTTSTLRPRQLETIPNINGRTISEALAANLLSVQEREAQKLYSIKDSFLVFAFKLTKGTKFSIKEKRWSDAIERIIEETIEKYFTQLN